MRNSPLYRRFLTFLLLAAFFGLQPLYSQNRFAVGVTVGPELSYVTSSLQESGLSRNITSGGSGLAVGFVFGGYVEYQVFWNLSLRTGLNYARKRFSYEVMRGLPEQADITTGQNRIVYTAIEVPLALVYRFPYMSNNDRFLVGVGGVVNRWFGDPKVETPFLAGSMEADYIDDANQAIRAFVGFDHFITDHLVLGIEPYLSYSPTQFTFESESVAKVKCLAGVSVRVRFDG